MDRHPGPFGPMVMVTLGDRGYRASDIDVVSQQSVMFMIVNKGQQPHDFRASLPMSSLQIDEPTASGRLAATSPSEVLDVTVPPGGEIDVTFVPTRTGRFALSVGEVPAGAIVVD